MYRAARFAAEVHNRKLRGEAKNMHLCPVKKVLMSRAAHFAAEVHDSSATKLNSIIIYSAVSRFAAEITFRTAESHFFALLGFRKIARFCMLASYYC